VKTGVVSSDTALVITEDRQYNAPAERAEPRFSKFIQVSPKNILNIGKNFVYSIEILKKLYYNIY
jgi:hypothetical protein